MDITARLQKLLNEQGWRRYNNLILMSEKIEFGAVGTRTFSSIYAGLRGSSPFVNVKMKMYQIADSKCTILANHFVIEYNLPGSDGYELQKRHLREGEIYAQGKS